MPSDDLISQFADMKAEHKQINKRLDTGDNHFAMIENMLRELEQELKTEIAAIKAELTIISNIFKNPAFLIGGLIVILLAGVAIGFALILGLNLFEPLSKLKEIAGS